MAVSTIQQLPLGVLLQIMYTQGIRTQISGAHREWELVHRDKVGDPKGLQENFMLQGSYGPSAIQAVPVGASSVSFPGSQKVELSEFTAVTKKMEATIEIALEEYNRAMMSKELKYDDPVMVETRSKLISAKRYLSAMFHLDGTGVLGQTASSSATVENGQIRIQLSQDNAARGHVGALMLGEWVVLRQADSTASALRINGAVEPVYFKVTDRKFNKDTIRVQPLDATFTPITVTTVDVQPATSESFYKYGQADTTNLGVAGIPDLTSLSGDYNTITEHMVGLDSLTQDDGRIVHGITMDGAFAGTREDANDESISVEHLENVLNNGKNIVGEDSYAWKQAILDPYTYSRFVLDREGDRRFNAITDEKRGAKAWGYVHRADTIELMSTEFAKKKRLYIMPEAKQGQGKVLEFRCTDFREVKAHGESGGFRLKPSANGNFQKEMVQFMEMYHCLVNKHPAAVLTIENFRS